MISRILVTGSRSWADRAVVEHALGTALRLFRPIVIVHGGCPTGADAMAAVWAQRAGVECEVWPADWASCGPECPPGHRRRRRDGSEYCPAAGPRRNAAMVAAGARFCLAFPLPDGRSRGTEHCVRRAEAAGIPVRRFEAAR